MAQLFSNNASSTLLNSAAAIDTTLTLATGGGAKFTSPTGSNFELLTIANPAGTVYEIVMVTARTGDVLTVTRAMEGTTALAWVAGSVVEGRLTKGTLNIFPQGQYDNGGNASGLYSITLQTGRTDPSHIANGSFATAIGYDTIAAGAFSTALGAGASATANRGTAIGDYATNRVADSHVITGMSLVRKDNGEAATDEHLFFVGSENIVYSKIVDLKTLADDVATITVPTGSTFYVKEVGVLVTSASGVTGQPNVSFGITGNTTAILASTATTKNAAKGLDVFTPISRDGINSLTASVKIAATGTTLSGRFYWKGMLVED